MDKKMLAAPDLAAYRAYVLQEERAASTAEKYLRDIRAFAAWLEGRAVERETVALWKDALMAGGLSPATVNAKLSAVTACSVSWAGRTAGCGF